MQYNISISILLFSRRLYPKRLTSEDNIHYRFTQIFLKNSSYKSMF